MTPWPRGPIPRSQFVSSSVVRRAIATCAIAFGSALAGGTAQGQTPVSRASAIAAAIGRGPRNAVARADSAEAGAGLARAKQFENPGLGVSYTKSTPTQHYALDIPIDAPWIRRPRIGSAQAALDAATSRFAFTTASLSYDTDTTYTRALAVARRAGLSQRNARDADSLLVLARVRRDAGDASELDVQLASVFAGQLANVASIDSLDAVNALLSVQVAMGLSGETATIVLTDSLALDSADAVSNAGTSGAGGSPSLLISAAEQELRAADLTVQFERRRLLAAPSLSFGFESHDPGGQNGALPTLGIAFPLPVFNRNGASILAAQAAQSRSTALLAVARLAVNAAIAQARRASTVARARAERSARLVAGADNIAALSLLAYREGASSLLNVLEAQRTSRATLAQYIDDLASARNAAGLVRLLSLTAATKP